MIEVPQTPALPPNKGWIYIISIDHQLNKVEIGRSESNNAVVGRLQSVYLGERKKRHLSYRRWYGTLFMKKLVIGWVDLKRVSPKYISFFAFIA